MGEEILFDVIEVEIAAPHRVRTIAKSKTERNADAVVNMAVMRRGVETHFFKAVPEGEYRDWHYYLKDQQPTPPEERG